MELDYSEPKNSPEASCDLMFLKVGIDLLSPWLCRRRGCDLMFLKEGLDLPCLSSFRISSCDLMFLKEVLDFLEFFLPPVVVVI